MMYGGGGGVWHVAILLGVVALWIVIVAVVLFGLYWAVRLAVTHALRARDRERAQGPGAPPHDGAVPPRPADPDPPAGPTPPPAPPTM